LQEFPTLNSGIVGDLKMSRAGSWLRNEPGVARRDGDVRPRKPKADGFGPQALWTGCLALAALADWAEILGAGGFKAAAWLMIIAHHDGSV